VIPLLLFMIGCMRMMLPVLSLRAPVLSLHVQLLYGAMNLGWHTICDFKVCQLAAAHAAEDNRTRSYSVSINVKRKAFRVQLWRQGSTKKGSVLCVRERINQPVFAVLLALWKQRKVPQLSGESSEDGNLHRRARKEAAKSTWKMSVHPLKRTGHGRMLSSRQRHLGQEPA
jgi:hypothetical protein